MFKQNLIKVKTDSHKEIIDITKTVTKELRDSGLKNGLINVFIPHTTACVTVNENDRKLWKDLMEFINKLVDSNVNYSHQPNADAHILSSLIKATLTIPFINGAINLGTYQKILLIELDGPRTRQINITLLSLD